MYRKRTTVVFWLITKFTGCTMRPCDCLKRFQETKRKTVTNQAQRKSTRKRELLCCQHDFLGGVYRRKERGPSRDITAPFYRFGANKTVLVAAQFSKFMYLLVALCLPIIA